MRQDFSFRCASLGRKTRWVRPAFLVISGPHSSPLFAPTDLPGERMPWFLLSLSSTVLCVHIHIVLVDSSKWLSPALSRIQNSFVLQVVLFFGCSHSHWSPSPPQQHPVHEMLRALWYPSSSYCRCGFLPVFFWEGDFRPGVVGSWAFSHLYCVSWEASFHSPPLPFSFSLPIF
jgi:hypothetical protein